MPSPTRWTISILSEFWRAAPNCFNDVKSFRACDASPFAAASSPACATAAANCFSNPSCAVISVDLAWRSASEIALNRASLKLNVEPAANSGRALQSAARKLLTAAALSPCCHAARAGFATDEDDVAFACAGVGGAELPADFLPQPANKIVAAAIPVMIAFFIKRNVAWILWLGIVKERMLDNGCKGGLPAQADRSTRSVARPDAGFPKLEMKLKRGIGSLDPQAGVATQVANEGIVERQSGNAAKSKRQGEDFRTFDGVNFCGSLPRERQLLRGWVQQRMALQRSPMICGLSTRAREDHAGA